MCRDVDARLAGRPERDHGLDPTVAEVAADGLVGVGIVGQQRIRTGAWSARSVTADPKVVHQQFERPASRALPGGGERPQRPASGVSEQVDLGAQPSAGRAECLPVSVFLL